MSNEKKTTEKSIITKARLRVHSQTSSTILRNDGLPSITDNTEKAVQWLAAQGFKSTDIEIIGEKPANWDAIFNPPVASTGDPIVSQPISDAVIA